MVVVPITCSAAQGIDRSVEKQAPHCSLGPVSAAGTALLQAVGFVILLPVFPLYCLGFNHVLCQHLHLQGSVAASCINAPHGVASRCDAMPSCVPT